MKKNHPFDVPVAMCHAMCHDVCLWPTPSNWSHDSVARQSATRPLHALMMIEFDWVCCPRLAKGFFVLHQKQQPNDQTVANSSPKGTIFMASSHNISSPLGNPLGLAFYWQPLRPAADLAGKKAVPRYFFCVPRNRVKAALRTKKNEETTQSWEVPRTHPSFARKNLENLLTSVRTKAVQGSTPRHLLDFSWDSPSWRRNPPGY